MDINVNSELPEDPLAALPAYDDEVSAAPEKSGISQNLPRDGLLFVETNMESDTYRDPMTTPAILFRDERTGEPCTYKQLTFENRPFHDRRRCKLNLVPVQTDVGMLELAHHITSGLVTKEPKNWGKWSTPSQIKLQVCQMQIIWQGLDSGQKKSHEWAGDSEVKLCATPIMNMYDDDLKRVFSKIADRGWNDRMVVTHGLGQKKLESSDASSSKHDGEPSYSGKNGSY